MKRRSVKRVKFALVVCGILSAISLMLVIAMVGVHVPAFNMWFYYLQFYLNDTYATINMQPEHLHEVTRHMIDYMRGNVPDLQIYTYVAGEYVGFFTEMDIRHMEDVKMLVAVSIWVRNIAFAVLFLSILPFMLLKKRGARVLAIMFRAWRNTAAITFIGLAAFIGLVSLNWQHAWYVFHEVIFTNEMFFGNRYWLLHPDWSRLIDIVPENFFFNMTVFIGLSFAIGLAIMFTAGLLGSRRKKRGRIFAISLSYVLVIALLMLSFVWVFVAVNVLGYIAYALVVIVILIILLALFAKFRYDIWVSKDGLDAPLLYKIDASWFYKIFKAQLENGKPLESKVFGIKINQKEADEEDEQEFEETDYPIFAAEVKDEQKLDKLRKSVMSKRKRQETKKKVDEGIDKTKDAKAFLKQIGKDDLKSVFKLSMELIKDIFLTLKPKSLRIRGKVGLEEPDQTGMLMAGAATVQALGLDVHLQADFEEKALHIEAKASGHFTLWRILRLALKFYKNREVKRVIGLVINKNRSKQRKDDKNGN